MSFSIDPPFSTHVAMRLEVVGPPDLLSPADVAANPMTDSIDDAAVEEPASTSPEADGDDAFADDP